MVLSHSQELQLNENYVGSVQIGLRLFVSALKLVVYAPDVAIDKKYS